MEFFIDKGYNYLVHHTSKQNWENISFILILISHILLLK